MSTANPELLAYQVREHEDAIKDLRKWRGNTDVRLAGFGGKIDSLSDDVQALSSAFNGLRRTLLGFAFTVAAAAVVFALSILAATGRL